MAATTLLQASLPSVHHRYPLPPNDPPLGFSADPYITPLYTLQLLENLPPERSSTCSNFSSIATATDQTAHQPEMAPKDPPSPPSPPSGPKESDHPPRLRPVPTSPVEIQGKLVRRRSETYVDRVARLRNPVGPSPVATAPFSGLLHSQEVKQSRTTGRDVKSAPTVSQQRHERSPQLQAPAASQGSLATRRRAVSPDFRPPRLMRTQPESIWTPLTGNARAIAAAFRDKSPPPAASRRTPSATDATTAAGCPDPVTTTPAASAMRPPSSARFESENGRSTHAPPPPPSPPSHHPPPNEKADDREAQPAAAGRSPSPRSSRTGRGKSGSTGGESGCPPPGRRRSYLSPTLIPGPDEPLRSFSEELSSLTLGSSDEDEAIPAPSPPPPPHRRRRGLTRSMAGRFKLGERGGLETDLRS